MASTTNTRRETNAGLMWMWYPTVYDVGRTLNRNLFYVLCLLGFYCGSKLDNTDNKHDHVQQNHCRRTRKSL